MFTDWETQHSKYVNSSQIDIKVYNKSYRNTSNVFIDIDDNILKKSKLN
jgi:hypothetical protein